MFSPHVLSEAAHYLRLIAVLAMIAALACTFGPLAVRRARRSRVGKWLEATVEQTDRFFASEGTE